MTTESIKLTAIKFETVESFLQRGGVIEVYNDKCKLIDVICWEVWSSHMLN
jgi:hypothetical protein